MIWCLLVTAQQPHLLKWCPCCKMNVWVCRGRTGVDYFSDNNIVLVVKNPSVQFLLNLHVKNPHMHLIHMPIFISFVFYHSDKTRFLNTLLFDRLVQNETQSIWVFALCVIDSCVCLSVCLSGVWLAQTCQQKYTHTHTFHCMYSTLGLIIYLISSYTLCIFIVWTEFRPVSITRHTFTSVSLWHTNL